MLVAELVIVRPETLLRWHGASFLSYWGWKSRPLGGRPRIDTELRALIRRMSVENPLRGAPRSPAIPRRWQVPEGGCSWLEVQCRRRCETRAGIPLEPCAALVRSVNAIPGA
jgi:hypothetical protein